MSAGTDLLDGLAQTIAAAGNGVYRADDSTYSPGETAVVFVIMPDKPDRVICLTEYLLTAHPSLPLDRVGVQIRTRGLPNDSFDEKVLRDGVRDCVHALTDRQYGSCHLIQMLFASGVPLGVDAAGRSESSQNFTVDVDMPATLNRPDGGL